MERLGTSWLAKLKAVSPTCLSIRFIVDLYTGMSGGPHRGRLAAPSVRRTAGESLLYVAGRRLVGTTGPSTLAQLDDQTLTVDVGNLVPVKANGDFAESSLVVAVKSSSTDDLALKAGEMAFAATILPTGWQAARRRSHDGGPIQGDERNRAAAPLISGRDARGVCAAGPLHPDRRGGGSGSRRWVVRVSGPSVIPDESWREGVGRPHRVSLWAAGQRGFLWRSCPPRTRALPGFRFPRRSRPTPAAPRRRRSRHPIRVRRVARSTVRCSASAAPGRMRATSIIPDAQSAIAIRVFSGFSAPASSEVAPRAADLRQFNRMYPSMKAIMDLSDRNAVVAAKSEIRARLLLPIDDRRAHARVEGSVRQQAEDDRGWIDAGCPA